jgi:hypothetical protein
VHRIDDQLTFTARLSTGIVSYNSDGLVRRGMRFGRVDADVRIYVQEVRAVHTAASDGGMRAAVRLPGMRRTCPRVLLTAPGCLTMSAEARQAGAKYERVTDGLHDPGKLHGPGCSCCVGRVSKMARRAKARASRPA